MGTGVILCEDLFCVGERRGINLCRESGLGNIDIESQHFFNLLTTNSNYFSYPVRRVAPLVDHEVETKWNLVFRRQGCRDIGKYIFHFSLLAYKGYLLERLHPP